MYAGSTTFMRLSSQNETLHKDERPLDEEASLEEQNGKWLNQVLKIKKEGSKKKAHKKGRKKHKKKGKHDLKKK